MPNVLEAVANTFKSMAENETKKPLHVGEAMSCWTYLVSVAEATRFVEMGMNTTTDDELKQALKDSAKMCEGQIQRLKTFMKNEGLSLPPMSEPKPKSDPNSVPIGAKMTDDEIANGLSMKIAAGTVECASEAVQCIRNDVALMFIEFQFEYLTAGAALKKLMQKRGWLKIPPYYYPPGVPNQ